MAGRRRGRRHRARARNGGRQRRPRIQLLDHAGEYRRGLRAGAGRAAQLTWPPARAPRAGTAPRFAATASVAWHHERAPLARRPAPRRTRGHGPARAGSARPAPGCPGPTSTGSQRTSIRSSPAARAQASNSSGVPIASARSRTAAYHSGGVQPKPASVRSTASFAADRSLPNTDARTDAAVPGDAGQLAQGRGVVGDVVQHERGDRHVEHASDRRGSRATSAGHRAAAARRADARACRVRGRPTPPSAPSPRRASPAAPVPAPASRHAAPGSRPAEPGHQVPRERDVGERGVVGPRLAAAAVGAAARGSGLTRATARRRSRGRPTRPARPRPRPPSPTRTSP